MRSSAAPEQKPSKEPLRLASTRALEILQFTPSGYWT
jgi:hypothetical protein